MANFFSFGSPFEVDVRLENEEDRQIIEVKGEKDRKDKCPIYYDGESVRGQVSYSSLLFWFKLDRRLIDFYNWYRLWLELEIRRELNMKVLKLNSLDLSVSYFSPTSYLVNH